MARALRFLMFQDNAGRFTSAMISQYYMALWSTPKRGPLLLKGGKINSLCGMRSRLLTENNFNQ